MTRAANLQAEQKPMSDPRNCRFRFHGRTKAKSRWWTAVLTVVALAMTLAVLPGRSAEAACPQNAPDNCHPDPPDNPNSPPSPGQVTLTNRTANSITVKWIVPERATSSALERSDGSAWVDIPSSGISYVDTGLAPDTHYCYRLRASNSYGSSLSPNACAFTKDGRGLSVSRVVLRITTGDVDDAGTDDSVAVSIGGAGAGSFGGTTWLDHSIDDFERNSTHDYDLVELGSIVELGDIHSLVFFTDGDDDWCLKGVTLLVDNVAVFSTTFGSSCEWIGTNASGGYVSHAALRADPRWATFKPPLPLPTPNPNGTFTAVFTIPRTELEARIEAMVGHSIHGTDAYWGHLYGRGVEATTYSNSIAKVDLDLAADVFASDPEVDIDFDLVVGTHQSADGNWHLDLDTANVTADVDLAWWEDLLDLLPCGPIASNIDGSNIPFCLDYLADQAADQIEASFPRLQQSFNIGNRPLSLTAAFDSNTDLVVTAILPPLSAPNPGPGSDPGDPGPDPEPDPGPDPEPDPGPDPCFDLSATPSGATPSLRTRTNCDG